MSDDYTSKQIKNPWGDFLCHVFGKLQHFLKYGDFLGDDFIESGNGCLQECEDVRNARICVEHVVIFDCGLDRQ